MTVDQYWGDTRLITYLLNKYTLISDLLHQTHLSDTVLYYVSVLLL